jgi:MtN3 and saliva related transmembrane protein
MSIVTALGLAAAFCTTAAFVPQAVKTWRTRSTGDLSLHMYMVLVAGTALWLAYGLAIGDLPLIAANGITLLLAASILYVKLRW